METPRQSHHAYWVVLLVLLCLGLPSAAPRRAEAHLLGVGVILDRYKF